MSKQTVYLPSGSLSKTYLPSGPVVVVLPSDSFTGTFGTGFSPSSCRPFLLASIQT